MGSVISSLFGGAAPKASVAAPIEEAEEEKKKAKQARVRLIANEGGIAGQELQQGQVRGGFFGNS